MSDISPFIISIKTAFTATFIVFFIGILSAWFMSRYHGKAKEILNGVLALPLVLPPTVLGFILLLIIGKNSPIGKALDSVGISLIFSWSATVIAAIVVAFPLMYRTSLGAFEQIDINILNAARTLGVSEWKIFWRLAIPLAFPSIAAGTTLAFARALGEFGATLMVAGSIPGKTETIPIAIYFAVEGGEMAKAIGWVVAIFLLSLSVMVISDKWVSKQNSLGFVSRRR